MTNLEKYEDLFVETFGLEKNDLQDLQYQAIPAWDSVGHMSLIVAIENAFSIMMDTDDIIDFNSFEKGKELLAKYNVAI
jgi:acyl carrier protein